MIKSINDNDLSNLSRLPFLAGGGLERLRSSRSSLIGASPCMWHDQKELKVATDAYPLARCDVILLSKRDSTMAQEAPTDLLSWTFTVSE